ncbi:phosphoinositide phosphatase SAC2 isoform X2 [Dendrobium catenatum]|uniref:phosphoinositide phosphatase SAC2 isoform X2 n=1 Tax=Dendrobium catenatum TaxID=906689 RepID=UPI0009F5EF89|nr:phosphoinositide phosphatase SAC2 isoform X2 [Dendrobium catenatum]
MRLIRDLMAAGDGAGSFHLQKFKLYETRSKFYMIGWDKTRTIWKVLSIDRLEPSELNIREDPTVYTESECEDLLNRIHNGNRSSGGLRFVTLCYGIIGFVKFLGPYYLLLITKRRKIGSICGHAVFAISKSEMIAIPNSTVWPIMPFSKNENRYKKLLCMVDLTRDFFFSYSFNLMRSLQKNLCDVESGHILYETMFVWNEFLTREIRNHLKSTLWTVALVYGFFKQAKLSVSGKDFIFTLIARRSRHYAGTRYLKRGVNEKGRVANEVETEQIIFDANSKIVPAKISSVVQIRGSIPLFWSQDSSWLNMKPAIILHKDQNYEATRLHFDNLVRRYENPIIIFNLIKTYERRPRESILRTEFAKAIDFINSDLPIENHLRFLHWDLSKHSRRAKNVLELLVKLGSDALGLTGFFYCQVPSSLRLAGPLSLHFLVNDGNHKKSSDAFITGDGYQKDDKGSSDVSSRDSSQSNVDQSCYFSKMPTLQKGVLRTNCIDCLDRTNVAQYAYGLAALGQQLHVLDFIDVPMIDLDSSLSDDVMDLYEKMGDTLSLQYGGSAAHNKIFCERRGQWKAATQSQEFFRTVQRYYSNTYMDPLKQDAINVFLGYFQPQEGKAALWELGSDQHYNIGRHVPPFTDEKTRSFIKRSLSEGNILCESDTPGSSSNVGEGTPQNMHTSVDTKGLSESTPEIPTCESDVSYSRYIPVSTRRIQFVDSEHGYFHQLKFDESSFSNFLDLDHISSSGNSCEEEYYERSSLINSPVEKLSTENVIINLNTEATSNLSWDGSRNKTGTVREVEPSRVGDQNFDIGEFSERFLRWVDNGGALCY